MLRNYVQNSNTMAIFQFTHHDVHQYLHNGMLSCAPFHKGHPKDLYLAITRKGALEDMQEHTTMSSPETSAYGSVVGGGVGAYDVSHWQKILASFIAQSSAALAHPYFYLIRTNTKWSMCLLSGLSPTIYSTLLLECELVSIRTNREDGTKSVRLAHNEWIVFLN